MAKTEAAVGWTVGGGVDVGVGGGEDPVAGDGGTGVVIGSDCAAAATGVVLSLRWARSDADVAEGAGMSAESAGAAVVG